MTTPAISILEARLRLVGILESYLDGDYEGDRATLVPATLADANRMLAELLPVAGRLLEQIPDPDAAIAKLRSMAFTEADDFRCVVCDGLTDRISPWCSKRCRTLLRSEARSRFAGTDREVIGAGLLWARKIRETRPRGPLTDTIAIKLDEIPKQ